MKKIAILLLFIVSLSADQLKVPSAYSTIQAGLNAASTGDTVLVAAGTYTENIIWPDVNGIKLISAGDSSNTIIDGGGTSTVIYMVPSNATIDTTTLIQGFKITNGGNVNSGGGMVILNASVRIEKVYFYSNEATSKGGTLFIQNSDLHLINVCILGSNITTNIRPDNKGGAIYIEDSNPTIENLIIKNLNLPGEITGGGIYAWNTTIENVHMQNISGAYVGGGIYLRTPTLDHKIKNCTFDNTNSWSLGKAIYVDGYDKLIYNCTFTNFSDPADGEKSIVSKGKLEKCLFYNNNTYAALDFTSIDSCIFANSTVGPLFFTVDHTISNSVFSNLRQVITPYIWSDGTNNFQYCTFINNQILFNTDGPNWSFYNCNIVKSGTIYNGNNLSPTDAANNYWGHSSGPYHPTQNPTGQGDSTNQWVNVDPWLTAPNTDAPPIPAQNLKLDSQTVTSATFSWDASKIGDLAGYKFYYDTDSSGYPYANSVDLGNVVTKSLTGLTTGTKYYIAVTTYDTDGNESWYSKEVSVTMNNTPVIAAVSDVTMNEDESSTITLTATDVENDAITYSAVSDTNAVTVSVSSATLTLTPNANWHGVANIKAYASDGYSKDSTSFVLTVTPVSDMAAVDDVTIDEDKSAEVTLTSTFTGTTTFTAVSDTNTVTISVSSSTLTLTPTANWHGVAKIKAYASDGTSKDSTSFTLTVTSVNDLPTAFEWVSIALDTVNITQSNLADTYTLQWGGSTDPIDGDSINYLVYAKIGVYPAEEIYDTTVTSVSITYQEILEGVFEGSPVNSATVSLNVKATDGIDTVDVTGDNRVIYVNRYEYLSTEGEGVPVEFALHENYPNPFNPTTTLRFDLPEVSNLTLTIYNMLGQKVRTFNMQSTPAGYHSVKWNATNDYGDPVGAGVYLYQLQAKDFVKTRKMVLLK